MRLLSRLSPRRLAVAAAAALALGVVATIGHGQPKAAAFESWCFDDPVVVVNGNLVDIQVQLPLLNLLSMRSTTLTVIIPQNVKGAVLVDDVSAFPMKTTISATGPAWNGKGAVPITVVANVQSSAVNSVRVQATPLLNLGRLLAAPVTIEGHTNTDIRLPVSLGR